MNKTPAPATVVQQPAKGISPIYIIGALFFVFGFVTWLNSVLIPYLKIACQLNNFESYLVAFAFYIAYFVMAIPSSRVLNKTGFKNGMSVGLLIMGVGALIFIPAALTRMYPLFLAGLFVQGTGLAVLQTASNPYITILGPIESAAKRISIMGICNKIAGGVAPIVLGALILKNADGIKARLLTMTSAEKQAELDALGHRVILPYIIILAILVLLAIIIYYSTLPEIDTNKEDTVKDGESVTHSVFQYPNLVLGVITLFLYVGVEVLAGDSIINYGASQGIPLSTAKFFTTCTMLGMIAGYIVGIICIPKYFTQANALKVSAILGVIFSVAAVSAPSHASILFIALLGLANSLMWPAIWPLAINGLGKFTKIGSSLLIMGIAGGALIPLLYGRLSDVFSPQKAYWILVPCYLFIAYYAAWGHKLKIRNRNTN